MNQVVLQRSSPQFEERALLQGTSGTKKNTNKMHAQCMDDEEQAEKPPKS